MQKMRTSSILDIIAVHHLQGRDLWRPPSAAWDRHNHDGRHTLWTYQLETSSSTTQLCCSLTVTSNQSDIWPSARWNGKWPIRPFPSQKCNSSFVNSWVTRPNHSKFLSDVERSSRVLMRPSALRSSNLLWNASAINESGTCQFR